MKTRSLFAAASILVGCTQGEPRPAASAEPAAPANSVVELAIPEPTAQLASATLTERPALTGETPTVPAAVAPAPVAQTASAPRTLRNGRPACGNVIRKGADPAKVDCTR